MRLLPAALAIVSGASTVVLAGAVAVGASAQEVSPPTPFEALRVERMLENRVACLGCHVIAGRGGLIGPSLDGLADRVDAAYVRRVITDPAAALPGTRMPLQRMPERDVERLAAYLTTRPPGPPAPAPAVTPEAPPTLDPSRAEDGSALYARHCVACHGPEGRGDGWNASLLPVRPTAHADAALMSARTDDALFDAIYGGAYVLDGSPRMPPFGALLSAKQIRALVSHIRTLCACTQPAWAGG